jgi:hypothetical protein
MTTTAIGFCVALAALSGAAIFVATMAIIMRLIEVRDALRGLGGTAQAIMYSTDALRKVADSKTISLEQHGLHASLAHQGDVSGFGNPVEHDHGESGLNDLSVPATYKGAPERHYLIDPEGYRVAPPELWTGKNPADFFWVVGGEPESVNGQPPSVPQSEAETADRATEGLNLDPDSRLAGTCPVEPVPSTIAQHPDNANHERPPSDIHNSSSTVSAETGISASELSVEGSGDSSDGVVTSTPARRAAASEVEKYRTLIDTAILSIHEAVGRITALSKLSFGRLSVDDGLESAHNNLIDAALALRSVERLLDAALAEEVSNA